MTAAEEHADCKTDAICVKERLKWALLKDQAEGEVVEGVVYRLLMRQDTILLCNIMTHETPQMVLRTQ